ncbi:phosphate-regulating neutral endopeptidase PHEX [Ixodes scapularis]
MKLLNETSGVIVNNYFGWKLLSKLGPIASHNMTTLNFNFNKVWRGLQGPEPRWRHCVSAVNDPYDPIIGNGMGKLYVDRYFNSTQKQDVDSLAESVREAHLAVIQNTIWMDNDTKKEAINKFKNVVFKLGYPEDIYQEDVLKDMYKHVGNVTPDDPFLDIYLSFRKNNAIQKLQKVHCPYNRSKDKRQTLNYGNEKRRSFVNVERRMLNYDNVKQRRFENVEQQNLSSRPEVSSMKWPEFCKYVFVFPVSGDSNQ